MQEIAPEIDRIDLRILIVLQRDGRISNLKLAERVAWSPTAVRARVQGAELDGYTVILLSGAVLTGTTSY